MCIEVETAFGKVPLLKTYSRFCHDAKHEKEETNKEKKNKEGRRRKFRVNIYAYMYKQK